MHFTRNILLLIIVAGAASHTSAQYVGGYIEVKGYSEVMSIGAVLNDWRVKRSGDSVQAGWRIGSFFNAKRHWSIGVEQRLDYLLSFTPQTARFYESLENNEIEPGVYPLFLEVNAAKSQGLFASYFIPLSISSSLKVTARALQGVRLQVGSLSGTGTYSVAPSGTRNVEYQYNLDYHYDSNEILTTPNSKVSGYGYSFDVRYEGRFDRVYLSMNAQDLLYRYHWQAGADRGCLSRPIDPDCSVKTGTDEFVQSLPSQLDIEARYHLSRSLEKPVPSVYISSEWWGSHESHGIGLVNSGVAGGYHWKEKMFALRYESDWVQVKWRFDQPDPQRAQYWQLNARVTWPLL